MAYNARPTIRRKILGKRLAGAREARGLSVEDVAEKAGTAASSIYRQESGHTAVKPSQIPFFAELYGIQDPDEIRRWTDWARKAKQKGTWATSGSTLGPTYRDYADAESLAEELRVWEPIVIPGLLQTRRYSEEAIRAASLVAPGQQPPQAQVDELVNLRESRKTILERDDPPKMWAVIGEAALLTPPSPSATDARKEQIQHLLNLGDTKISIQVLPLSTGLHVGTSGAFCVISFDNVDMAFREGYGDGSFVDDDALVRPYRARYERLVSQALSIVDTRRYLHQALSDL